MEPNFNVWLEIEGDVVASLWRTRLLTAIEEGGSITEGARLMRVPYRVAWRKVHEMEEGLGIRLLETQTGGPEGGSAHLTAAGREHVARMQEFCDRADRAVRDIYREVFRPSSGA